MIQLKIIPPALLLILSGFAFAQDKDSILCAPETSQFDFWVGKWKAVWENSDGTKGEGTNTINSILDGCVIQENFDAKSTMNFTGKSFSVYNPLKNYWQQTWVDNQGSYMVFTGGMMDDKMILSRKITFKEKEVFQRMIFYNISEKKFDWEWESSTDGGKTWELKWRINYTRIN
jgi:hypothetical protein